MNHSRSKKVLNLSSAQALFGSDRETVVEAFPGDVIGVHNPGLLAIGDTLYTGNKRISYPGIPSFSPEVFAYCRNPNPSNAKKFNKGLQVGRMPTLSLSPSPSPSLTLTLTLTLTVALTNSVDSSLSVTRQPPRPCLET